MRSARFRRWLAAAGALLTGIVAGLALSFGAPRPSSGVGPARHEDPRTAAVETDPAALIGWYLTSVSHFQGRRFPEGRRMIVRLGDANLASDLRALAGEVDILMIKEASILEAPDLWLREGAGLLAAGRFAAAEPPWVTPTSSPRSLTSGPPLSPEFVGDCVSTISASR